VDFFRPKNPTVSAGFEPAILGTTRPPKPLAAELLFRLHGHRDRPVILLLLQMKIILAAVSMILDICRLNEVNDM
jgi:hypothetical protein